MSFLKSFTLLILFLTATISMAQNNQNFDCKILKDIKLKYAHKPDNTDYIIIKDNKHVENLEDGKYYIKSDLEWLSDCEYNATMTEITLPDFPFKAGEIMNVKFEKIKDDTIYGTATVRNQTFPIKFIIIK
ncbi:hypothetical protein [Flavobacterium pectinovorum]|uniref:Uncharacterized protein n=1 Tax=Flavobacterium pectinovorum TaxID=29533 RepID=A0A502EY46_9FLAO|nr:hypothetical protein [Flavobacterium pectinovorum]TPG41629.1 hypothetical protein EAH81_09110 [Flavobacterium pectinovorum]